jgi:integrase
MAKQQIWHNTGFPGVRYRKHATRRHGVKRDSYFQIRYQKDGRRVEEALGWASKGMTPTKAAGILAELVQAATTGKGEATLSERRETQKTERAEEAAGRVKFEKFWAETYLPQAQADKSAETIVKERSVFKKWLSPLLGSLPFKSISPIHIERLKSEMAKAGKAPRSIQYAMAITRQVINEARRRGIYAGENPLKRVKFPKFDNRRQRFFTHDEAEALLSELLRTDAEAWEMALLSLHCGLRAGEIFKLTPADIDTARGLIAIKDSKGGRNRFSHMTGAVKEMLLSKEKMLSKTPGALLYPGPGGALRREVPRTIKEAIDTLGFNEGLTDRRDRAVFHSLRHSFASWHVQGGTDLYTLRELLGHSTLTMTARYSHLAPENSRRALEVMEASLTNGKTKKQETTQAG